jgi:hypothetical protein
MVVIAGIIVGTIALVVVLLFAWLGIFNNSGGIAILGGVLVLILVGSIPGILIGLLVFRGYKKKGIVLIGVPAFIGIVGGVVVGGAVTAGFVLWVVYTYCC